MANTNTAKTTKSNKSVGVSSTVQSDAVKSETSVNTTEENKSFVAKEIDQTQYIPVKNGFHGKLIYVSKRTGERFVWSEFGDEQEIELRELRNVRGSAKDFYINNWFMFDDEYLWVIDYLGVGKYYDNAISIEGFDEILSMTPAQISKTVSCMSDGQKSSLMYKVCRMISDGKIDSHKTISALEDALGVELIEH